MKKMHNLCFICRELSTNLHEHHVYMQSYGGKDGPTVPLCPNHHNLIHALAKKYPRDLETSFTIDEMENGTALVKAIVRSTQGTDRQFKVTYNMDNKQRQRLGKLKTELGLKSLEATVDFCVQAVFQKCGI